MSFDLSSKVVLVAGGAGYLGRSICRILVEQGASLMVADVAQGRSESLIAELAADGKIAAIKFDASDPASSRAAIGATIARFGRLDVLVNATCHSIGKKVEDLEPDEFDLANRVNLTGTFVLAREAAQAMGEGGSIILFASMYGLVSPDPRLYEAPMNPNPIEYGVGKAGIVQMTKYLAVYWGGKGIRVNAIAPGPFPNPAVQSRDPDFIRRLSNRVPLGRIGHPEEIGGVVAFLASNASTYINGETISVDGGWTAW